YERSLQKKSDDPRLHFNAGTAAYRNQQFDQAAKHFDQTASSPDLKLQEQAYYNLGNTLYHLGERSPDPKKKSDTWEQALKKYENSLKLDPQDADAKFNHDFVKKKLEELKQQQQQQQQQQQDSKQDQSKKDPNQQQNQNDQTNKDQQQKSDSQSQDQKKDS